MALTDEDALSFLIEYLRDQVHQSNQYATADLDIEKDVAWDYFLKVEGGTEHGRRQSHDSPRVTELTEPFANAAWQLSRLGVLRPGSKTVERSTAPQWYFTCTDYGRAWLTRPLNELVFTSPDRSAQLLGRYRKRLGDAFLQRGIEAGECYRAGLYLACVAMCGAAREAILVTLAQEHFSVDEVDREYRSSGGRGRLETRVVGKLKEPVRRDFRELSSALDFWRDYAAHGLPAPVGEPEAFRALRLLLRLAQFVDTDIPRGEQHADTPSA